MSDWTVGAWGQSSAHFQIVAPPYVPDILTPDQDTVWTIGSQETITWSAAAPFSPQRPSAPEQFESYRDTSNLPDHVGLIPQFELWMKASYGGGIDVTTLATDIDPTLGSVSITVPADITPGTYFIVGTLFIP